MLDGLSGGAPSTGRGSCPAPTSSSSPPVRLPQRTCSAKRPRRSKRLRLASTPTTGRVRTSCHSRWVPAKDPAHQTHFTKGQSAIEILQFKTASPCLAGSSPTPRVFGCNPSTLNPPQPSSTLLNPPQPSTLLNPQPSSTLLNSQPPTLNPQPSTINHQP
jgi:hypothetical protein